MKKILLHEPDADIFDIMALALDDQDCSVKALPDYNDKAFSQQIISYDPDLVIIDCFLDQIRPMLWCKKIRSISCKTRLIVSSCNNDIHETYQQMGFDNYLSKPFDINELTNLADYYTSYRHKSMA